MHSAIRCYCYLDDVELQCREIAEDASKDAYEPISDDVMNVVICSIINVEKLVQFGRIPNDDFNGIIWGASGGCFCDPETYSERAEVVNR